MASDFDTLIADSGLPGMRQVAGRDVLYRPPTGGVHTVTATVEEAQSEQILDHESITGTVRRWVRQVMVDRTADTGIENPSINGRFVIDGEVWSVDEIVGRTASETIFRLVRSELEEIHTGGYRSGREGGV